MHSYYGRLLKKAVTSFLLQLLRGILTAGRGGVSALLRLVRFFHPSGSQSRDCIPLMVFGTRVLNYWVLGPSGFAVKAPTRHITILEYTIF